MISFDLRSEGCKNCPEQQACRGKVLETLSSLSLKGAAPLEHFKRVQEHATAVLGEPPRMDFLTSIAGRSRSFDVSLDLSGVSGEVRKSVRRILSRGIDPVAHIAAGSNPFAQNRTLGLPISLMLAGAALTKKSLQDAYTKHYGWGSGSAATACSEALGVFKALNLIEERDGTIRALTHRT